MASTITFGEMERRVRRDLINDNDEYAYRWGVKIVMSRMNQAVVDVATRFNSWARYNQDTGARISSVTTPRIKALCDASPSDLTDADVDELRAIVIPIDDRYADAVVYITAARLLESDDSDTMNVQKAAQFMASGKEYAER